MVLAVDMVLTVTGHTKHVTLFEGAVALGTPDECQVWSLCDSLYDVIQFSFIKLYCFSAAHEGIPMGLYLLVRNGTNLLVAIPEAFDVKD